MLRGEMEATKWFTSCILKNNWKEMHQMLSLVSLGGGTTSYCLLLFPPENFKFSFNEYLLLAP